MRSDTDNIKKCIELARNGELYTAPNPMVGCVIVHDGNVVAQGYHQKFGEAHAEVNAFAELPDDVDSSECEVFVNLEPCSHYGKTPPCADFLVSKQPKRVIIGMLDPNPKVAGKGIKKLLEAGIDVKVGVLEDECKVFNKKFIKAHTELLPYVTLKWAETKNGFMASENGQVKISDNRNDEFVHTLRATHQAILIGANTLNIDNPMLDVRHSEGNSPLKVVLSRSLSLNKDATLLKEGNQTVIYNSKESRSDGNSEYIELPDLSILAILKDLYSRGIHSILVEGGANILSKFIDEKVWDQAIILKSKDELENGLKAPWVGIPSYDEKEKFNDIIKYFRPA